MILIICTTSTSLRRPKDVTIMMFGVMSATDYFLLTFYLFMKSLHYVWTTLSFEQRRKVLDVSRQDYGILSFLIRSS